MNTHSITALRLTAAPAPVATAAVGALVAPGGTAHADTPRPAPSSISIRAVHSRVSAGTSDKITGDLHVKGLSEVGGRSVTLESKSPGETGFMPVGVATTGEHGGLTLAVTPAVTTRYRWDYAGAADARARTSGVATVHVGTTAHHPSRIHTSLSVRAKRTLVDISGADLVKGHLRSKGVGLPKRSVVLLARPVGSTDWGFAAAEKSGDHGLVRFTVKPKVATAYRLQFSGTTVFRPSHSGSVRVGVRPTVSISATPTRVDPGGSTAIGGTVTAHDAPVGGATVDLLASPAGRHHFAQVATGTTATDGSVSLTATPTKDTTYRLRLEHSSAAPAAVSKAVEVRVRTATSISIRGFSSSAGYTVSGVLRAAGKDLPGRSVTLESQAPDALTWSTVTSATTGAHGGVQFTEPVAAGTGYRLVYAGATRLAPSVSGTVVEPALS